MYQKQFKTLPGVTFIEIMIVIVIMAAIAALAGPALFNQFGGAKVKQARIQMDSFVNTLSLYRIDNNRFPDSDQGLKALIQKPELGAVPANWNGPYLTGNAVPKDPWGNDFVYTSEGQNFKILSLGADGQEGGQGNDADIVCTPSAGCN